MRENGTCPLGDASAVRTMVGFIQKCKNKLRRSERRGIDLLLKLERFMMFVLDKEKTTTRCNEQIFSNYYRGNYKHSAFKSTINYFCLLSPLLVIIAPGKTNVNWL